MNQAIMPAILSCSGYELTDDEKYFFAQNNPLGLNIFGRNIKDKEQLKKLIKKIDPESFVYITKAKEVNGFGFRSGN